MNCMKCDKRAELHPEYKKMKWEDTPCSKCNLGDQDDTPDWRTLVVDPQKMAECNESRVDPVYFCKTEKTNIISRVLRAALDSDLDRLIIRQMVYHPDQTQEEMARHLNISSRQIRRRIAAIAVI